MLALVPVVRGVEEPEEHLQLAGTGMTLNLRAWIVVVNQGQRQYVVETATAWQAASAGSTSWDNDKTIKVKQRERGIYDLRIRPAKFSERPSS